MSSPSFRTADQHVPVRSHSPRRSRARSVRTSVLSAALAAVSVFAALPASATQVGAGSFFDGEPSGYNGPMEGTTSAAGAVPAVPYVVSGFSQVPVTHKWWTHLMWHYWQFNNQYSINLYSQSMMQLPECFLPRKEGAAVGFVGTPYISNTFSTTDPNNQQHPNYLYPFNQDMVVGLAGMSVSEAPRVKSYSDWAVDIVWNDGANALQMTASQYSPYLYFQRLSGGSAYITTSTAPTIVSNTNNVLIATIAGNNYGFFAPSGSTWSVNGSTLSSSLAGKSYFSVALLPNTASATIADFTKYAFSFITGTSYSWSYNPANASVTTTFNVATTAKEGTQTGTLTCILPHQYKNGVSPNTSYTYPSPRGTLKVLAGSSFATTMRFNGVLPALPDVGDYNRSQLAAYIDQVYNDRNTPIPNLVWQAPLEGSQWDGYWTGCAIGRLSGLVHIADELGMTAERDYFLDQLQWKIQDWLTYTSGESDQYFFYDTSWHTLIPKADVHHANDMLNDHHFDYGYYIRGAATIAQYRPTWASASGGNWGAMVEQLIKDFANWDRNDSRYPYMSYFSPMDGHTWATGPSFSSGQNEESSSESMNAATALILWGSVTGNTTVRDLGVMWYTNQANAIEQYWFDVDHDTMPAAFSPRPGAGMIWSDGVDYSTWWTIDPREIQGIQLAPMQSGSVYLGRRPSFNATFLNNLNTYQAQYGGFIPARDWRDLIWLYQATDDGATAASNWDANAGNLNIAWYQSFAFEYHWVHDWKTLGHLDTSITANIPTYNVFRNGTTETYVAFNPSTTAQTVTFSDGKTLNVPAGKILASTGSGGGGGDTTAPSVPSGLGASNVGATSFTVSWSASSDNVGVTGYDVYVNGTNVSSPTGTSATISGLSASTTYSVTVDAFDAAGNHSAQSAAINVTTSASSDTTPPSVPSGLSATSISASGCTLSWSASTDNVGVAGYNVFQNGSKIGTASGTSFNVSGLSASTTYSFTVSAYDASGNTSGASSALSVTTQAGSGGTITIPAQSTITSTSFTGTKSFAVNVATAGSYYFPVNYSSSANSVLITVTFNGVSQSNAVNAGSGTVTVPDFVNVPTGANTLTITAGSGVTITLVTDGLRGGGGGSSDTTAPSVPSGLSAANVTSSGCILNWTASTDNVGVTGYKVYQNGSQIGTASGTSFTVSGLSAGTAYSFTVAAYDAAGNTSSQSSAVTVTTSGSGSISIPAQTTVTSTSFTGSKTFSVNVTASGSYYFPVSYSSTGNSKLISVTFNGVTQSNAVNTGSGTATVPDFTNVPVGTNTLTVTADAGVTVTAITDGKR